jgi:hypothetical protein
MNTQMIVDIKAAKKVLAAKGYEHICSTMTDGDTKEYGLVYLKDGHKVYVNKDTASSIITAQ